MGTVYQMEHPEEQSEPNEATKEKSNNDPTKLERVVDHVVDRSKSLQECRDQYDECVADTHHMPAGGLGHQNSSGTTQEPLHERRHCAKTRRRCIERVRGQEQKIEDRRQTTENNRTRPHSQPDRIGSRTEDRGQEHPFLKPALGIAPVDGVHATSFALGALVAFTLSAVAYFVRRTRGTKQTDSRVAYGAATVQ